jgi:DNA-binding NtrC family response regulator
VRGQAGRIVLIDDDKTFRRILSQQLGELGYQIDELDGRGDVVGETASRMPEVILLDLELEGRSGLDLLRELTASGLDAKVIMVTGTDDAATAVRAIRQGAFDFITKPVKMDELRVSIERAIEAERVARERDLYRTISDRRYSFVDSKNPAMRAIYDLARKVAKSETTTVLIQGESGTGKEHIAHLIHQLSSRGKKPFLEINCASLPETLLESELFGHEKGAFTDAASRKRGLLELADGGSLFLDEVGEMALPIQVKLLRVLERMTFRRVGGTHDIQVSVRIISATNRDLAEEVRKGRFREDLYFRLKVVPIVLPPLRERIEDLPALVRHFLGEFSRSFGKNMREVSPEALAQIRDYAWPGNIRELRNCLERAVLLNEGEALTREMLQIPGHAGSPEMEAAPAQALASLREILEKGIPEDGVDYEHLVGSVEKLLITRAAEKARWNQSQVARYLHLNRDKLRTRLKNFGLGRG